LPDSLNGSLEGLLLVQSGFHLLVHIITQMAFQFMQWDRGFDTGREHLLPPFPDGLLQLKHIAPSTRPWVIFRS
jgi:hypothetical protein